MNGAGGERQRNSLPDDGLQIGTPYSPARRPEVKEEGGSAPVQEYQGEEEGDRLYSTAMRDLFSPGSNLEVLDVIRLQNLYNTLENSLDYCEDVSDIIEQVIISNT